VEAGGIVGGGRRSQKNESLKKAIVAIVHYWDWGFDPKLLCLLRRKKKRRMRRRSGRRRGKSLRTARGRVATGGVTTTRLWRQPSETFD